MLLPSLDLGLNFVLPADPRWNYTKTGLRLNKADLCVPFRRCIADSTFGWFVAVLLDQTNDLASQKTAGFCWGEWSYVIDNIPVEKFGISPGRLVSGRVALQSSLLSSIILRELARRANIFPKCQVND